MFKKNKFWLKRVLQFAFKTLAIIPLTVQAQGVKDPNEFDLEEVNQMLHEEDYPK